MTIQDFQNVSAAASLMNFSALSRSSGMSLALLSGMNMRPFLRWTLRNGADALTCQVNAVSANAFDVHIVPHWNRESAVRQRFESANEAVRRHAEIVGMLREHGWTDTEYRQIRSGQTAA